MKGIALAQALRQADRRQEYLQTTPVDCPDAVGPPALRTWPQQDGRSLLRMDSNRLPARLHDLVKHALKVTDPPDNLHESIAECASGNRCAWISSPRRRGAALTWPPG